MVDRRGLLLRNYDGLRGLIAWRRTISQGNPAGWSVARQKLQEKRQEMKQCKNCESVELVYSGTDAFLLGVPTETFCYPCANQEAQKGAVIC
jgi:hypothetical protein